MAVINQTGVNGTNHTYKPADANLPLDDEDEFKARKEAWNIAIIVYRMNMVLTIILSVGCLILILVIFNQNVRRKSPLWYWFHITILSVFCGLFIHVPAFMGDLVYNKPFCRYVMYSPEYVFTLTAFLLILLNSEVLFSYLLSLESWQIKQISRFVVSVLLAWLLTTFIVGHVTIENNVIDKKRAFCFYLDKEAVKPRLALRDWFPGICCFFASGVILFVFCLQKLQPTFFSTAGNLHEMKVSDENGDKLQMILMTLLMNALFILRVILYAIVRFEPKLFRQYIKYSVMMFIHSQVLYLLPFPALLVPEVRSALCLIGSRCIRVIAGPFKGGINEESSTLHVRYEDVKA